MLVADDNLQLLPADTVGLRPQRVVLLHDLRVDNDPLELVHDALVDVRLLADHRIVLVVGVVGIPQLAVRPELKLQELVTKLALVADIVANVEVGRHAGVQQLRRGVPTDSRTTNTRSSHPNTSTL